jgi:hypothetical protein
MHLLELLKQVGRAPAESSVEPVVQTIKEYRHTFTKQAATAYQEDAVAMGLQGWRVVAHSVEYDFFGSKLIVTYERDGRPVLPVIS